MRTKISNFYIKILRKFPNFKFKNLEKMKQFIEAADKEGEKLQAELNQCDKHNLQLQGMWFVDYYFLEDKNLLLQDIARLKKLNPKYKRTAERIQPLIDTSSESHMAGFWAPLVTIFPKNRKGILFLDACVKDEELPANIEYIQVQIDNHMKEIYSLAFHVVFTSKVNEELRQEIDKITSPEMFFSAKSLWDEKIYFPSSEIPAIEVKRKKISKILESSKLSTLNYLKQRFQCTFLKSENISNIAGVEIFSMSQPPDLQESKPTIINSIYWRLLGFYWDKHGVVSDKNKDYSLFWPDAFNDSGMFKLVVDEAWQKENKLNLDKHYLTHCLLESLSIYFLVCSRTWFLLSRLGGMRSKIGGKILKLKKKYAEIYQNYLEITAKFFEFNRLERDFNEYKHRRTHEEADIDVQFVKCLDRNIGTINTELRNLREAFEYFIVGQNVISSYSLALKATWFGGLALIVSLALGWISFSQGNQIENFLKGTFNGFLGEMIQINDNVNKLNNTFSSYAVTSKENFVLVKDELANFKMDITRLNEKVNKSIKSSE